MNSINTFNKKILYLSGIVIGSGIFFTYKYFYKYKNNTIININENLQDKHNNIKKYNKERDDILNKIEEKSLVISKAETDYNIALERFNSLKEKTNFDILHKDSVEDVYNKNRANFELYLDSCNQRLEEINRLIDIYKE